MLKYLVLEEFAVLDLNVTGFSEVVQKSRTSGSLIPHMWDQWAKKKFFFTWNFQALLHIKPYWFFECGYFSWYFVIHAKSL